MSRRTRSNTPARKKNIPVVLNERLGLLNTPLKGIQDENLATPVFPSPLLTVPQIPTYSPAADSVTHLERKFPLQLTAKVETGKAGTVFRALSQPGNRPVVIKRQIIEDPHQEDCTAYRELQVLQNLQDRLTSSRHHFLALLDWNKTWVNELFSPLRPLRPQVPKYKRYQCINFIFKDAGKPLSALSKQDLTFQQFQEVLFQVLYALYESQEVCQLMHNDLHAGNVLLRFRSADEHPFSADYQVPEKRRETRAYQLQFRVHVTLIDFGLSRIALEDGSVLCNPKTLAIQGFDHGKDVDKFAQEIGRFKIASHLTEDDLQLSPAEQAQQEIHNRSLKKSILSKMRKGTSPRTLLLHEFFHSLYTREPVPTPEEEATPEEPSLQPIPFDLEGEDDEGKSEDELTETESESEAEEVDISASGTDEVDEIEQSLAQLSLVPTPPPTKRRQSRLRSNKKVDWNNLISSPLPDKPSSRYSLRSATVTRSKR